MPPRLTFARPFASLARPCRTQYVAMPLKARIMNPAVSQLRTFASETNIRELPGDEPDDVLFNSIYGVRTIELNRPKKLNSLNGSMARKIVPRLLEWQKSQLAQVIILKGAGRALCAGGDVAALALWNQEGKDGQQKSADYFALEYKLDHLIATLTKPYVALMDGITMGGGVGLSVHAPFRIATEKTVFAMPETTIGFFPDVGGSFFLPRLDGAIGTYLALTSERVKGVNAFLSGIATHYIDSSSLPALEGRLAELQFKDQASLQERFAIINDTIEEFNTGLPNDEPRQMVGPIRKAIDECFSRHRNSAFEVLDLLTSKAEDTTQSEELRQWASATASTIKERSPTSVLVTLKQMREGRAWTIGETFQREHQIAARFMAHPDFVEGVSARLIRKPPETPKWQPDSLEAVDPKGVDQFFEFAPGSERLQLLNYGEKANYQEYPHNRYGLPTEDKIQTYITSGSVTRKQAFDHFLNQTNGKLGVKEKLGEVLERRTIENDGVLAWQ